jgi:hypothetical protein
MKVKKNGYQIRLYNWTNHKNEINEIPPHDSKLPSQTTLNLVVILDEVNRKQALSTASTCTSSKLPSSLLFTHEFEKVFL